VTHQTAHSRVTPRAELALGGHRKGLADVPFGAPIIPIVTAAKPGDGLPFAEEIDIGVRWDWGAPTPVLVDGRRTFVAFYLARPDPDFDGTNPRSRNPRGDRGVGIVKFVLPAAVRMGAPNDEVLSGHPLWGRGLSYGCAHVVHNSEWIQELMAINSVHPQFRAERWASRNHYVFTFKDETLECVANGLEVTTEDATLAEAVQRLTTEAVGS
jgi:hypothetical protein